jgi:DNA repair protein RecO (recombination protein O)
MQITKAIVLRTIRYSDSRLVVSLYTEHYGMVSAMVRFSRGAKGRSNGALWQLLNVLEIGINYSANAAMQKIGDCSISVPWTDLPYNPMKASVAMFLSDMLYHSLRGEGENRELFCFLENALCWFDEAEHGIPDFHVILMAKLTRFLGIWPGTDGYEPGMLYDLNDACYVRQIPSHGQYVEADEASLLASLFMTDFSTIHILKMSRNERRHMLDILLRYYQIHVPGFGELQSLDVLRELFS